LDAEKGVRPYPKELRAGQVLADHGYNVTFLVTANDQKNKGVPTSDTNIEGMGLVEIYTPNTDKVDNIVHMIIRKKQQAPALFVQTDLDDAVVQSIADRVWGNARASEINVIFFQRSNGILIEKSRK
jgi:filamentous hemagglutinin